MTQVETAYITLKEAGAFESEQKLARGMKSEKYIHEGWTYTFWFCDGQLKKAEAFNGFEHVEMRNEEV